MSEILIGLENVLASPLFAQGLVTGLVIYVIVLIWRDGGDK